ncbi:PAP2 family phosphoesterase [Spirochaetia bacterium]|nr:PAP2 family phosphoesterase [Spirochaetia bacterium]
MKKIFLPASFIILLLLIASFFDLQIDQILYRPQNIFSKIFSGVGVLPQFVIIIFSPSMALCALFVMRRNLNSLYVISGGVVVAIAALKFPFIFAVTEEFVRLTFLQVIFLYMLCLLCTFFITLPFAKKMPREVLTVAITGALAEFAGAIILAAMKDAWGRRRFFTMDNPALQFTQWYLPQDNAASDDYMSFPSGHSFSGMLAVWFALFPHFIPALKKWTKLILTAAVLFGFATMLSRLMNGKHFLSDVTMGSVLALLSLLLAKLFVDKIFAKKI